MNAILCLMNKRVGDSVCMLPALRELARRNDACMDIVTRHDYCRDLYRGVDFIRHVYNVRHWTMPLWLSFSRLNLAWKARKSRYRLACIFSRPGQRRAAAYRQWLTAAGVTEDRIVFMNIKAELFFDPEERSGLGLEHYLPPALSTTEAEKQAVREKLRAFCGWTGEQLVFVHPGSNVSSGDKWWPTERWGKVISGIRDRFPECMIVVTGSKGEQEIADAIIAATPGGQSGLANLAGLLSIREMLPLQMLAHSGISNDTGMAHTALAVGCPTVVVYDRYDPRWMWSSSPKGWGPAATVRGFADLPSLVPANDKGGMQRISAETVLEAWSQLPPRSDDPPGEGMVRHYYEEGGGRAECLPVYYDCWFETR